VEQILKHFLMVKTHVKSSATYC